MYALTSQIPAIRDQEQSREVSLGLRDDPIQPLVIRANEGDCVEIMVTNSAAGGSFGMQIDGLPFDRPGDKVGRNFSGEVGAVPPSTTVCSACWPLSRRTRSGCRRPMR
jgi:hypothetical protein